MNEVLNKENLNWGGNDLACFSWVEAVRVNGSLQPHVHEQYKSLLDGHNKNIHQMMGTSILTKSKTKRYDKLRGEDVDIPLSHLAIVNMDKLKEVCLNNSDIKEHIDMIFWEGSYDIIMEYNNGK